MVDPITSLLGLLGGGLVTRVKENIAMTGNPLMRNFPADTVAAATTPTATKALQGGTMIKLKRKPASKGGTTRAVATRAPSAGIKVKKKPAGKKGSGLSAPAAGGIGFAAGALAGYGGRLAQEYLSGQTLTVPSWVPVIGGMDISKQPTAGPAIAPAATQPPPTVWNSAPPPPVYIPTVNYEVISERTIEPIRTGVVSFAEQQGGYYANYPGY